MKWMQDKEVLQATASLNGTTKGIAIAVLYAIAQSDDGFKARYSASMETWVDEPMTYRLTALIEAA